MNEDFHKVRDAVRNGDYLKANMIRLYKYRNVLKPIQIWESTPEGRRQNYEAVNEKQKLIQNVQTEIDRRLRTFYKAVRNAIFAILIAAIATVLGRFLYDRYFSPATPQPQNTMQSIQPQKIQGNKNNSANQADTLTQDKTKSKKQ